MPKMLCCNSCPPVSRTVVSVSRTEANLITCKSCDHSSSTIYYDSVLYNLFDYLLLVTPLKMASNIEEYFTRDDSEIEDYDSDVSMNDVYQFDPPSSDSEELINQRRINRKRPRKLSTSSEEETSEVPADIEIAHQTGKLLWSKTNLEPKLHIFDEQNAGVKGDLNPESTPLDAFQMTFSEELVAQITEQTNNYFKYVQQCTAYKKNSRLVNWKDASVPEMYVFLCISMLMPRSKKLTLNEYWSMDELLKSDIFRKLMARDRYMVLLQMLHFNDNNTASDDPLVKIQPVIDKLKVSFSQSFAPYKYLCIDESLLLYKGRCYFKQYIPSKRSRFGIKLFLLCDCKTNYVLDFIIYTGQKTNITKSNTAIGISGDVVMTLLQPYLGKGHALITDNWYTSPGLYTLLHENKTNAFGTVRRNRKEMPHMEEKLKRGEMCYRSTDILLAMKWHDKKEVWMLSSAHAAALIETEKRDYRSGLYKKKPSCIVDYNSNMGAVDRVDMILSTLNSLRKTIKWYKKLFFHLLDLAVYNAYILYKKSTPSKQKFSEFHLTLIREILRKYFQRRSNVGGGKRKSEDLPFRLIDRHFPSKCPNRADTTQLSRRKCVVCVKHKRRSDTRYECKKCDVGLCIDNCFEIFHTQLNY